MSLGNLSIGERNLNNLVKEAITRSNSKQYNIDEDGYLVIAVNFKNVDGYFRVIIYNGSKTIFDIQVNCGANATRSYSTAPIFVKAGWSYKIIGENITNSTHVFSLTKLLN